VTRTISTVARQSWLALLCCSALGTLGLTIVNNPSKSNLREVNTQNFPQPPSLTDLQHIESKSLPDHKFSNQKIAIGRQYRYRNPQLAKPIDIQVRYITDGVANRPAMVDTLPVFTDVPTSVLAPATVKEQPDVGEYSLFVHKDTAYLGTCINPHGITTATGNRFQANSNPNLLQGLPLNRLLPWLLGQQTLRDSRCIWTVLSTPIDRATPDGTMKKLETIGVTWIRWWQANFPAA
jgi:cyanosortase A-associated protein